MDHFNISERNELPPFFDLPKYNLWEEGDKGILVSYFSTWSRVLFKSEEFFKRSLQTGWVMPLLFGVISEVIGLFFYLIYHKSGELNYGAVFRLMGNIDSPGFFLLSAIAFLFYFPIVSLFLHSGAFILGGKGGLNRTFRVVTYSSASSVFYAIPYIGVFLSFLFRILVMIRGFRVYHDFSTARSIFALLLPTILLVAILLFVLLIPLAIVGAGFLKNFLEFMKFLN